MKLQNLAQRENRLVARQTFSPEWRSADPGLPSPACDPFLRVQGEGLAGPGQRGAPVLAHQLAGSPRGACAPPMDTRLKSVAQTTEAPANPHAPPFSPLSAVASLHRGRPPLPLLPRCPPPPAGGRGPLVQPLGGARRGGGALPVPRGARSSGRWGTPPGGRPCWVGRRCAAGHPLTWQSAQDALRSGTAAPPPPCCVKALLVFVLCLCTADDHLSLLPLAEAAPCRRSGSAPFLPEAARIVKSTPCHSVMQCIAALPAAAAAHESSSIPSNTLPIWRRLALWRSSSARRVVASRCCCAMGWTRREGVSGSESICITAPNQSCSHAPAVGVVLGVMRRTLFVVGECLPCEIIANNT